MNIVKWLNNIASSFQPSYDKIKAWKLTPQQEALVDSVWLNIGPTLQKLIWAFIAYIYEKYGADAAKKLLERILVGIKNEGWIVVEN